MFKYILIILLISNSLEDPNESNISKVYMTKKITSSNIVKLFKKLNITLGDKIGLKVHSGETGGIYFLTPDFLEEIYNYTNGTFIECNAAYKGARHTTELHEELLIAHGWRNKSRRFEIMDADPSQDWNLQINNGIMIHENIVGAKINDFDSCIVLSHLKGHSMGGFGGALKQLSIGFASQSGKTWIHTAGKITDWERMDDYEANQENFTAAMGDAAASIVEYFKTREGIAFINVVANISEECDCYGGGAPVPRIKDIGILASTDPVAIDRASIDLIRKTKENGTEDWVNQLERLKGENTIKVAEYHGIGTQNYTLILIDEEDDGKESKATLIIIVLVTIVSVSILVSLFVYCVLKNKSNSKYQEDFHLTQKMNE